MAHFSTITGHEAAISRLQAALANGSIGHAYLFAGPSGVGKTTTARAFARALSCEAVTGQPGSPTDSCGMCAACRQADAGVHPDVHLVRPALLANEAEGGDRKTSAEILISQVRTMIRTLSLSPAMGRRKIVIVSPADAMNHQAQNALLKSLEEPPGTATLILCAESAESVLATIRSRCQTLYFGLAPAALIQMRLREVFSLSAEEAASVAAVSQGRVGRAFQLASDPAARAARGEMMSLLLAAMQGGPLRALQSAQPLRDAAQKCPVWVESRTGAGSEAASDRLSPKIQLQSLLDELASLLRDLLLIRLGGGDTVDDLIVNLDRKESLRSLAKTRSERDLRRSLESALGAQDLLRRNVNPILLLEDVLLQVSEAAPA